MAPPIPTSHILIADANAARRRHLRQQLGGMSVLVGEAITAEMARAYIDAETYQLLYLDADLPGLAGSDLADRFCAANGEWSLVWLGHPPDSAPGDSAHQRLILLGDTALGILHEANQPLSLISAFLQMLKRQQSRAVQTVLDARMSTLLDQSLAQTQRLTRLFQSMQVFAPPAHHARQDAIFALSDALADASLLMAARLRHLGITLQTTLPDSTTAIRGRRSELTLLLVLMLRLSSQCCPNGTLKVSILPSGECLVLTLSDSGGTARANQDDISFAQTIVHTHHGDLAWSSESGEARFTLIFPAASGSGVC